jgi:membrane-bound metal-dependent hydrolase YbcI (DUF457 family)
VDPVTHTLIGVTLGNAFFRKRLGRAAVPVLALASNLPDVDTAVHLTGDPASLLLRRTFGHSVFTLPIWSALLAAVLRRFVPETGAGPLFAAALAGACAHVFFDLVNSFGVVLLWPFSDLRPELAIVFIVDLPVAAILLGPLLAAAPRRLRALAAPLSRAAVAALVLYVAVCAGARARAAGLLADHLSAAGARPEFTYVFPEPPAPHLWRGVAREGDLYRLHLIRVLSGSVEMRVERRTEIGDPAVERVRATRFGRRLEWFFKAPVWTARRARDAPDPAEVGTAGAATAEVGPAEVVVEDLRFRSLVIGRGSIFTYAFQVRSDGSVVRE